MSDTPSHAPVRSIVPKWVRGPQDFVGGIALMAIAVFALWASSDLQGMHGFSFGAGTAPRMFAGLLLGLIEILSAAYIGTTERDFFSFAILILILLYRPTGLFGTRTTE